MRVGIDLGTTNSVCAYREGAVVKLIPDEFGETSIPSAVGVDARGAILVGRTALNQLLRADGATVVNFKRLMGTNTVVAVGPYRFSPEELAGRLLGYMRANAEQQLGRAVREAVITVPAHFNHRMRTATREAAVLAGFRRVWLLNEPTAAAVAHTSRGQGTERVVVVDFGGGTCDVSCLERSGDTYRVHSSLGDGALGGRDIDARVVRLLHNKLSDYRDTYRSEDPVVTLLLERAAEHAKMELSVRPEVEAELPFLHLRAATHPSVRLRREELEDAIGDVLARLTGIVDRAVYEAGFDSGFDTIVFAGGSTRIPAVRKAVLRNYKNVRVAERIVPEEVTARGAAHFAHEVESAAFSLHEAMAATVAIETDDGRCVPLIARNSSLPAERTREFVTTAAELRQVDIHLVQGESRVAAENQSLGRFVFDCGNATHPMRIVVQTAVDVNGVVTVRVHSPEDARSSTVRVHVRPPVEAARKTSADADYAQSVARRLRTLVPTIQDGDLRSEIEQMLEEFGHARTSDVEEFAAILSELLREALAQFDEASYAAS